MGSFGNVEKRMLTSKSSRSPFRAHFGCQANMAICELWTLQHSPHARPRARAIGRPTRRRVARDPVGHR
eukprot:5187429-Pyramimonas_sp.AAC.1